MRETVGINGLSLCHKNSTGFVQSTLPDVCKAKKRPAPFTNVAFSTDLAKGTTTVKSHGGAMCGIKGAEFSKSIGDEPGKGKGVKSGTQLDRATFLSWSPNVFMEGKPVTRLTDRMLLNDGNTISAGGYFTGTVTSGSRDVLDAICDAACRCQEAGTMNELCVQRKVEDWAAQNSRDIQGEPTFIRVQDPDNPAVTDWIPRRIYDSGRWSQFRQLGSRAADFVDRGTGTIIEVKLIDAQGRDDPWRPGQLNDYLEIQDDTGLGFQTVIFSSQCACGDDGDEEEETVPVPNPEDSIIPLILRRLFRGPPIYIPPNLLRPRGPGFGPELLA